MGEVVPHAGFFCSHISAVVVVGSDFDWNDFDDFEPEAFESATLDGVVCHESHLANAEEVEDLSTDAVFALVGSVSEVDVSLDGVESFFLELISLDFVHKTYATSFLVEVNDGTAAFSINHLHGAMELLAAVAAHRCEDVAGGT